MYKVIDAKKKIRMIGNKILKWHASSNQLKNHKSNGPTIFNRLRIINSSLLSLKMNIIKGGALLVFSNRNLRQFLLKSTGLNLSMFYVLIDVTGV